MTKAVRVHKVGGPEALVYEDVEVAAPGPGEIRIRQHAVGLNFIDVYYRTGLYKAPGLPFVAGNEAAGEVVAVGPGVTNFHPRDRVAYYFNLGGYARAALALADGCGRVVPDTGEDFGARVNQVGRNELCDVVYAGVGKTTFPGSLSCLRPRGLFVSFGNASGPVPPFALAELNNHGSLFATRPKLNDYVGTRNELLEGADTLFAAVINGKLHVPINHAYALKDAAKGHIELDSRRTPGATILRP